MSKKSSLNNSDGHSTVSNVLFVGSLVVLVIVTGCISGGYKILKSAGKTAKKAAMKGVRFFL